jgi:putative ABC transport system ATP-binding protein
MQPQYERQTGHGVLGGGAARALIHHLVVVAVRIEKLLQIVGIGLPVGKTVTGRDAVAVADKRGSIGGMERPRQHQQTTRDENRAPNVHVYSVAACVGALRLSSPIGEPFTLRVMGDDLIQVKGAKKWIQNGTRRVEILRGISLDIPPGQFVAIVGASGSGKSTLLGLMAGLDTPSEGEIWLDGEPIHNLAEAELAAVRGRKIGFVFQSYRLIQTLTALENVLLPYELNLEGSGLAQARHLLDEVGLSERMDHYPVQLSGGEQQRVALARAFVAGPPIVMADEPTGNLDSTNGKLVLDLLLERNRKTGTTLVLVTHDPEIASRADRKIVLKDGVVVEDSTSGALGQSAHPPKGEPWPSAH